MTGAWSEVQIDHRDTRRGNNAWANLRQATQSQNIANASIRKSNTSGFKGVSFIKETKQWGAWIKKDGKSRRIGVYVTPEEAHRAYCQAAVEAFGEFARAQ